MRDFLVRVTWYLRVWIMAKKKKLTPEQRKFLRSQLGPMLAKLGAEFAFGFVPKIRTAVEALPAGSPKPELEPPTLQLFVALFFPLHRITMTIRAAVVDGKGPEYVFSETTAAALEIVKIILANETEAHVEAMYRLVDAEVKAIFASVDFWEVLEDADDVFGD